LTNPEAIKEVHRQYFAAGADIASAASYQATVEGYMRAKAAAGKCTSREEAEALIRRAVELAKEARDEFWQEEMETRKDSCSRNKRLRPLVAASVGCYGAAQADGSEYRGQYGLTEEELMAWHRPRLHLLAQTGPDLLAFETVPCEVELRAILRLLQEGEEKGDVSLPPCWITVACRDGTHLNSGDSLESCAKAIVDAAAAAAASGSSLAPIVAFGVNCTPPQHVKEALGVIARVFAAAAAATTTESSSSSPLSLPLLICYPNSGEIWEDKEWKAGTGVAPTPEAFTDLAEKWVAAGARIVGGCCRTTPETIAALRARLVKEEED
jgi:homocysteine S-methyltransferase